MPGPDSVVINDGFAKLRRGRRRKNGTRGKGRVTIEVKSEPLLHVFDDRAVGQGPAEALKELIVEGIKAISEDASAMRQRYRRYAKRAFDRGARWAQREYSGGRTGSTPPQDNETRAFNFSGRLLNLAVRLNSDDAFTINVPANRFSPDQYRSLGRLEAALDKLRRLVPVLDPKRAAVHPKMKEAVAESIATLIQKARDDRDLRRKQLRAARLHVAAAALRAVGQIAA